MSSDPATITDHPFRPLDPKQPWGRCGHFLCGLSEAAHKFSIQRYEAVVRELNLPHADKVDFDQPCPDCGSRSHNGCDATAP